MSAFPRALIGPDSAALTRVIEKTIIGSYAPNAPLVSRKSKVSSIGSCFAREISLVLQNQNVPTVWVPMAETSNSAFALSEFLQSPENPLSQLADADLIILTFGMSLCWFNSKGEFVAQAPDASEAMPSTTARKMDGTFYMRQTTVEENEKAIQNCLDQIRALKPNAHIVMTLSPVPLAGTRYDIPAVPANTISKAVLRSAIENVRSRQPEDVYYWPSYEIVTWYGCHVERSFGDADLDARHVKRSVVDMIADLFLKTYIS